MKYVLLFVGTMDDQERFENMSPEETAAGMKLAKNGSEEYARAGKIVGGEQFKGPQTATTVRFQDGKPIVTDGPFIESKEVIGGFAIVQVKDLDEALEMAKARRAGPSRFGPLWNDEGLTETSTSTDAALSSVPRRSRQAHGRDGAAHLWELRYRRGGRPGQPRGRPREVAGPGHPGQPGRRLIPPAARRRAIDVLRRTTATRRRSPCSRRSTAPADPPEADDRLR